LDLHVFELTRKPWEPITVKVENLLFVKTHTTRLSDAVLHNRINFATLHCCRAETDTPGIQPDFVSGGICTIRLGGSRRGMTLVTC
jgi:hypothetical protein